MSEPKWTPGPWCAEWDDNGQWYIEPLGITGSMLCGDSGECIESANAHLIAAAPEMHEALENCKGVLDSPVMRRHFGSSAIYTETVESIRAALAKARGEA